MNVKEIARAVIAQTEKFYSEDQPRDASGKWGGGSAEGEEDEGRGEGVGDRGKIGRAHV